jgi:glycosyltransferase involved in cell wall biosynthesis
MKVAFVNQPWTVASPPDECDSIAIWTHQVTRHLTSSCQIVYYGRRNPARKEAVYREDGVLYRGVSVAFDKLLRPLRILDRWGILNPKRPFFASSLYYLGYIWQVANDLRKQQCDIVHIHNFSQFVPIIRFFNPRVKIVLHMHCEWLTQLDAKTIARRLDRADLVIGCSDYITEKIRRRFPQFANRCNTVFNGVDTNHFVGNNTYRDLKGKENWKLLFVGRISPEKGVHILLDAFQQVVKHYPKAKLEIAGPESIVSKEFIVGLSDERTVRELESFYTGSYLTQLKSEIPSELATQILFPGAVPQEQLLNHYWDADILINPSLSEAFGMSLVEGMATETPVIGARVGGMTCVVEEGKTGLLVEPSNASALAEAIVYLLSKEDLRKAMGRAGRQRVLALFSWEKIAKSLLLQYQNLYGSHEQIVSKDSPATIL